MSTPATSAVTPADLRERPGRSTWWYLIYLLMLGSQPLFEPTATAADWVIAAGMAVIGIILYGVGEFHPGRVRVLATWGFVLLGLLGVWVNTGAAVAFVYAAAFAGTFEPRAVAQRWLLGLTAALGLLALLSPVPMPYRLLAFGFPLVFIWAVGSAVMEDEERKRDAARLRIDNARIEHVATLTERERIARDLHDLLGHTLTGVVVRAQLVRRLAETDPQRAGAEVHEIENMAREALAEVRATVSGWRHYSLEDELAAAEDALTAAGVSLTAECEAGPSLTPSVEAALALVLREAVTNVVRHAEATTCTVAVRRVAGEVVLTISDDGVGGEKPEGSGITGMRERIVALGGQVERIGRRGTTLTVTVPGQVIA